MRIRRDLLQWQFSGYAHYHHDRVNLIIHMVAVPFFWLGTVACLASLFGYHSGSWLVGLPVLLLSFLAQGIGHKREQEASVPFDGALDVVTRILAEQFVTFPRFLLARLQQQRSADEHSSQD
ncbi:Protein of unknown function [Aeromonas sp. RU39B]|uniref:Mpo1-like protein n=1 Tax=Aeromonas sp. RU39B TaxID=1907416 RepID=UPI0009549F0D|nr:Mpo1-like protein [Aeromonas sp. RU39B]SIQ15349.1 Protein of unknown function [Aeromonas sp. RU39B]